MNTLRDTDESRPKPSVWPVYVAAAALLGVFGLLRMMRIKLDFFLGAYVLLGVVAAVGLVRLRLWGWWCAVVWTGILIVGFGWLCFVAAGGGMT